MSSSSSQQLEAGGPGPKRQKVNHKPPPDALQHKFKPFVQAAYDMVSNPSNQGAVRFNQDGTAVEIIDVSAFSDKVLPRYFKHKNISSFIRQMNMYGFEKIDGSDDAIHTFKHEYFKRDQPALLPKILRKPVKSHRRAENQDSEDLAEDLQEIMESKRAEAHQAVDELTRLKQVQAVHEERIRLLEEENQHLTEENKRIKGAVVQVKSAQTAMTDRLRRLFVNFMRYYVRDDKAMEDTIRHIIENTPSSDSTIALTDPQRQVINSLFQLKDEEPNTLVKQGSLTLEHILGPSGSTGDELVKSHSLTSPWEVQPIVLPTKPKIDGLPDNSEYVNFAKDLASHIDENDQAFRRIDTLTNDLQDVEALTDDFLEDILYSQNSFHLQPGSFAGYNMRRGPVITDESDDLAQQDVNAPDDQLTRS